MTTSQADRVPGPQKVQLVCGVTPDLVQKGIQAGKLVGAAAACVGGGGGGRPEMAQAGGKDAAGVEKALDAARRILAERKESLGT